MKKGDLVYDPFVGTGSILVAAAHFGAHTLGADIDIRIVRDGNQLDFILPLLMWTKACFACNSKTACYALKWQLVASALLFSEQAWWWRRASR